MNIDALKNITIILIGIGIVFITISSTIRIFVLPRAAQDPIARFVFALNRIIIKFIVHRMSDYNQKDSILAYYAPISLLMLLFIWYMLILGGYTLIFWGLGAESWYLAFRDSGSSLLTLGFEPVNNFIFSVLAFTEAVIGLILVALLIAYLPTMYSAFSRRETAVKLLEVRAGNPPSAVEMLKRYYRIQGMNRLLEEWKQWENWFTDIDESHTSLAALVFFRSPQPHHSWITSAGAVLDCASIYLAALDLPYDARAALCIRAGYLALQHIADFFQISYSKDVQPGDWISINRTDFYRALDELQNSGIPIKRNREQAWLDFSGWRINYDIPLLAIAELISAPEAPWITEEMRANMHRNQY